MGGAASSNHAAVYAGRARLTSNGNSSKKTERKAFYCWPGSRRAFTRVLCNVLEPNSRKDIGRADHPNLGAARRREPGYKPLGDASTKRRHSRPDDNAGSLSPEDIRNTGKQRMLAQASPSLELLRSRRPSSPSGAERLRFETDPVSFGDSRTDTTSTSSEYREALKGVAGVRQRDVGDARICSRVSNVQPAVLERNSEFMHFRLDSACGSVADASEFRGQDTRRCRIEYNYERDGETVIPAGSKAFGELSQVNEQGYVGIQFHSIQLPDETTQKLRGTLSDYSINRSGARLPAVIRAKKFLVRSLTGVGTILAATVGVQTGTGITDSFSNTFCCGAGRKQCGERGQQQLNELAIPEHRLTVPATHASLSYWRSPPTAGALARRQAVRFPPVIRAMLTLHPECAGTAGAAGTEARANADVSAATEDPNRADPPDQQ